MRTPAAVLLLLVGCVDEPGVTVVTTSSTTTEVAGPDVGGPDDGPMDMSTTGDMPADDTTTTADEPTGNMPGDDTTTTGDPPSASFDLLCFVAPEENAYLYDFDDTGNLVGQETVSTNYFGYYAGVLAGGTWLVYGGLDGGGGIAWTDALNADNIADVPVNVIRPLDAPNQYAGLALTDGGAIVYEAATGQLDQGAWSCTSDPTPICSQITSPEALVNADCSNDGTCIGGGTTNGLLRSTDSGATWTKQANDYDPERIVAGPDGTYVVFDFFNQQLLHSQDGGQTWNVSTVPMGADEVRPIASALDVFIAGQYTNGTGIFVSSDAGMTFAPTRPVVDEGIFDGRRLLGGQLAVVYSPKVTLSAVDPGSWVPVDVNLGNQRCARYRSWW